MTWAEFSPDSRRLATSSDDKTVRLWDVATGDAVCHPLIHSERVVSAHFSTDGRKLLTRTDHALSVFDAEDGKLHFAPPPHEGKIVEAKFLADGKAFFVAEQAGQNSSVQVWDIETETERFELRTGPLIAADVTPDLSHVATVFADIVSIWDVASRNKLRDIVSDFGPFVDVVFNQNGQRLAALAFDQWARVYSTESGQPFTPKLKHGYFVKGLAFLDQGDRLLTWGEDALAKVWDASTGERLAEPMHLLHRVQYAEAGNLGGEVFLTMVSHLKSRSNFTKTGAAQLWRIRFTAPTR